MYSTAPAERLQGHVHELANSIGERHLWRYAALLEAARYIEGTLSTAGQTRRQTYEISRLPVSNIELTLAGTSKADEIVVVGAHYDTVAGCPGANDNGTGIAAVLELAHRFAGRPRGRTVRFVAFVNEEPPFFQTGQMGSLVYAREAKARGDRVVGMLSLETMGYYSNEKGSQQYPAPLSMMYPDVGDFIGMVSNVASARLLARARRAFRSTTDFPLQTAAAPAGLPGVGWSDHWAFWEVGYPALMVTDTAPFRYPWYHTPDDTPERIDFASLAEVVRGLEGVIDALLDG